LSAVQLAERQESVYGMADTEAIHIFPCPGSHLMCPGGFGKKVRQRIPPRLLLIRGLQGAYTAMPVTRKIWA